MKQIEQVSDLDEFANKVVLVRKEIKDWSVERYGRLWHKPEHFSDGAGGYALTEAIRGTTHMRTAVTARDIEAGKVFVRLATPQECESITLSYGEKIPAEQMAAPKPTAGKVWNYEQIGFQSKRPSRPWNTRK